MSEVTAAAASKFANWPQKLIDEFEQNRTNGHVGSKLVSETDHVRVWHLTIPPHSRFGAHCHVLDYFWTAMTAEPAGRTTRTAPSRTSPTRSATPSI